MYSARNARGSGGSRGGRAGIPEEEGAGRDGDAGGRSGARNYVELRGFQNQQAIVRQASLAGQQETCWIWTRNRVKQGVGSELDVARASALVSDTAARIPTYERQEWQSIHRLAILTNQPLEKLMPLRDAAAIPAAPESVLVGVPAELLRAGGPDIRRAERQLAAGDGADRGGGGGVVSEVFAHRIFRSAERVGGGSVCVAVAGDVDRADGIVADFWRRGGCGRWWRRGA